MQLAHKAMQNEHAFFAYLPLRFWMKVLGCKCGKRGTQPPSTREREENKMTTHINDFWLTEYCNDIAEQIAKDAEDITQAYEWATESADGSEYAIYTAKAHAVMANCNTSEGQAAFEDIRGDEYVPYDELASSIVCFEIEMRIYNKLSELYAVSE